ncbi:MAG: hypothetical protein V3U52_08630 [Thermoplasmata archaeon]
MEVYEQQRGEASVKVETSWAAEDFAETERDDGKPTMWSRMWRGLCGGACRGRGGLELEGGIESQDSGEVVNEEAFERLLFRSGADIDSPVIPSSIMSVFGCGVGEGRSLL